MNWDDLRLFLALVRAGNVRRAGRRLGVSHSTVARRVEQFETTLGVRLIERTPEGYLLSAAGEYILAAAERVEHELDTMQRQVTGQDQQLAGAIRFTTADELASALLMPDLARFSSLYRDIDLEITVSYEAADLVRREADVALRLTMHPPANLIGRKVGVVRYAAYTTTDYLNSHDLDDPADASWIGIGDEGHFPGWVKRSGFPHLPARGVLRNISLQVAAARSGLGIGFLPCFMADGDERLVRIDAPDNYPVYDLWLLRHSDTRQTARLRVFMDFLTAAIAAHKPALLGEV